MANQDETIIDPCRIRAIAGTNFISAEMYKAEPNGHKFKPGDNLQLHGLKSYPEYNGQMVKITAIREDGPEGRAYYIAGAINYLINWVYEYRLRDPLA